jgi:hypothetical protein
MTVRVGVRWCRDEVTVGFQLPKVSFELVGGNGDRHDRRHREHVCPFGRFLVQIDEPRPDAMPSHDHHDTTPPFPYRNPGD